MANLSRSSALRFSCVVSDVAADVDSCPLPLIAIPLSRHRRLCPANFGFRTPQPQNSVLKSPLGAPSASYTSHPLLYWQLSS
ncbi:unnamed protein product [Diplocarpon coronariae]